MLLRIPFYEGLFPARKPPCVVAENYLLRSVFEGLGNIVPFEELAPRDGILPALYVLLKKLFWDLLANNLSLSIAGGMFDGD